MRITVCELPHEPELVDAAWAALRDHTAACRPDLVLLPEFAMTEPVWQGASFVAEHWAAAEELSVRRLERIPELLAKYVAGTRPVSAGGRCYNEGYLWSETGGLTPLRRKAYFPNEPGAWEGRWFERGDGRFPVYRAGPCSFGLNICSELWALETYAGYASRNVDVILAPRATSGTTMGKWFAVAVVAAVRSGAYCMSSNRRESGGAGSAAGWIIDPDGQLLAQTNEETPFVTIEVDLNRARRAKASYPRYVFAGRSGP